MSFADERRAIEARFAAAFTVLPVAYENQKFAPPANAAWVALTILPGEGRQVTIGGAGARQRYAGVIQVDVYVPEETGTATARGHADTIETVYRQVQFSAGASGTITTATPFIVSRGIEDGWYRLVVSIAYRRDKTF